MLNDSTSSSKLLQIGEWVLSVQLKRFPRLHSSPGLVVTWWNFKTTCLLLRWDLIKTSNPKISSEVQWKTLSFVWHAWHACHAWHASHITKFFQASCLSVLCFLVRPGLNAAALALIAAAHRAKVAGLKVLLFFLGSGSIATVTFLVQDPPQGLEIS